MKQRLLVDLDSLLDTRLATLAHIDPQLAVDLAGTSYRNRQSDDFDSLLGISINEEFKKKYQQRDIETLKAARCTGSVVVLHEMTNEWEELATKTPFVEDTGIDINTYPYKLNENQRDAMATAVMAYSGVYTNIETVRYPIATLTPDFLNDHYTGMIIYDINEWLHHHIERLQEKKIPDISVVAPALYHNKIPEPDEVPEVNRQPLNPFACLEMALVECISLNLLDPKYFSIIET